ncbi:hypothetical protein [Shewanella litorisediminis]|uniref:Uncharacterized protein n=1 Tax=Shewanella litorisediminis TaxID=1173586 RepID=A0ABX7G0X2_9GAMM|nr:hypothetical protein [Shewanella litorisediminis]MCL2918903.1 hypothetical protein [Shewanella litorisediminis]QRH00975.1 hypothetical protein JQC75_14040 [Shewanella litorisediminis]
MKVHKTSIDSPTGQQTIMHQRWRAFTEAVVKLPEPVVGKVHGREHGLPRLRRSGSNTA